MARKINQVRWDQWRERIERQRASGLPITAFCRTEDVSPATFYTWKRKLRDSVQARQGSGEVRTARRVRRRRPRRGRSQVGPSSALEPLLPTRAAGFLQLPVRAARTSPWIEMTLTDGTLVRVPQENLAALLALVKLLRGDDAPMRLSEALHA
jgi:transposase-like protein